MTQASFDIQIESFGMLSHFLDQIKTGQSFGKAGIIIDPVGEQHLSARDSFFNHDMIESGAGSV